MVCSTAARTGMKIVRSCSFPTSLQFMCCQVLRNYIPGDKDVGEAINLAPGLKLFLFNNLDWLLRPYSPKNLSDTINKIRKRTLKFTQSSTDEDEQNETSDGKRLCTDIVCAETSNGDHTLF